SRKPARLVADGFDVVAIGIEYVAAVVVGVVPTQAGRAVVGAAGLDCRGVEGVHVRPALGPQRDLEAPAHRIPLGLGEEGRSSSVISAKTRRPLPRTPSRPSPRAGQALSRRRPCFAGTRQRRNPMWSTVIIRTRSTD